MRDIVDDLQVRYEYAAPPLRVRSHRIPAAAFAVRSPLGVGARVPGGSWGYSQSRKRSAYLSIILHLFGIAGVLAASLVPAKQPRAAVPVPEHVTLIALSKDVYMLPPAQQEAGGGGGGGEASKLPVPKGRLPKLSTRQITPPAIVVRNERPKLPVEPTVVAPPKIEIASSRLPNLGDPAAPAMPRQLASNGTGSGGGIGSGSGGGVGKGTGPGIGEGRGGGIGGGVFRVAGGVLAPRPISTPDPQYTDEARQARYEGTCALTMIVGPDGKPRDVRIQRGLGMGLDKKAIQAVEQWRFSPATKDGQPVSVQITVEVSFKLY
jgi:periplasmic protein TonB